MTVIKNICEAGRGHPGVRPETTLTLTAMALVEAELGTARTLDMMVNAVLTVSATLGAADPRMFEISAEMLEGAARRLRQAEADIAGGRQPKGAVVMGWNSERRAGQ